jgi:hypothetical protein
MAQTPDVDVIDIICRHLSALREELLQYASFPDLTEDQPAEFGLRSVFAFDANARGSALETPVIGIEKTGLDKVADAVRASRGGDPAAQIRGYA